MIGGGGRGVRDISTPERAHVRRNYSGVSRAARRIRKVRCNPLYPDLSGKSSAPQDMELTECHHGFARGAVQNTTNQVFTRRRLAVTQSASRRQRSRGVCRIVFCPFERLTIRFFPL